ncbi:cytochrome d ubiquinol oxidase subunit II [Salinactinospora qingdaonensis]|uniref:Cytochrome d ubiquinol oxidase subunit II n=1 Tax=Salinactinospora qingdaonensis TaxID=702744 RepID=A0ABP7FDC2_9ACTN
MIADDILLAELGLAVTAYALLGGADFGGGFWDLFAGGSRRGMPQRRLIEHAIGPVWEANHVWLIYAVVLLWSAFPTVFAAVASTCYIPLTLAALGIIGRGAGFAFRKTSTSLASRRAFGAVFAFSSVATPFCLGAVAGGIASGRVPPGIAAGGPFTSWLNPTSVLSGLLAVGVGAYLAAVFLTRDAQRERSELAETFRRRALGAGVAVGALAAVGLVVVAVDAPALFGLLASGPALALVVASIASGAVSLVLLALRRYVAVRVTAALAAAAIIWAWGAAQYPLLLPGVTISQAAAGPAVLHTLVGVTIVGTVVLAPSLWWMFHLFQRFPAAGAPERADGEGT